MKKKEGKNEEEKEYGTRTGRKAKGTAGVLVGHWLGDRVKQSNNDTEGRHGRTVRVGYVWDAKWEKMNIREEPWTTV